MIDDDDFLPGGAAGGAIANHKFRLLQEKERLEHPGWELRSRYASMYTIRKCEPDKYVRHPGGRGKGEMAVVLIRRPKDATSEYPPLWGLWLEMSPGTGWTAIVEAPLRGTGPDLHQRALLSASAWFEQFVKPLNAVAFKC